MTPGSRSPPRISSAASTTAPSTQPPETEPATSPASLTAIAAPGSRGLEPITSTTRAIAAVWPAPCQRATSASTSFSGISASLRDHRRDLLQRGERMAFDEHVDVRQRRGHALRERRIARAGLERVDPDDLVGDAREARHLL